MKNGVRPLLSIGMLLLLCLLFSGCVLKILAGVVVPDEEGPAAQARFEANSITAECGFDNTLAGLVHVECIYYIYPDDSEPHEVETTGDLIEEFGVLGVLIDPVILQLPEDVYDLSGEFAFTSNGFSQPLVITEADSFKVQPGETATPEPGQKFVIVEFPEGWPYDNIEFDFELTFRYPEVQPIEVKALFAGRIDVEGGPYYVPLLPCTSDFSDVPGFTIPVGDTPQDLLPDLLDYALQNDVDCHGWSYDFEGLGTPTPTSAATPEPPIDGRWGDDDCNLTVAATDALKKLQDIASLPYALEPECPEFGTSVGVQPSGSEQRIWGDTDCDGDYDAVDALAILRSIAALPVNQSAGCPIVGSSVMIEL